MQNPEFNKYIMNYGPEEHTYWDDEGAKLIMELLTNLKDAGLEELAINLRGFLSASRKHGQSPIQKAITVIRSMIEDKGADPDTLLIKLQQQEKPEGTNESLEAFLQYLSQQNDSKPNNTQENM